MKLTSIWFSLVFLSSSSLFALAPDGITRAAEYYYARQDYRQALQLWVEVVKKQPNQPSHLIRLSELKLMIEGKKAAQEVLLAALQSKTQPLTGFAQEMVAKKLTRILSTFVSDEAQSFFLQAKPKLNFKDCPGALLLLNQSLSLEGENVLALKEKALCERELKQWGAYVATAQILYELNPFDPNSLEIFTSSLFYQGEYAKLLTLLSPSMMEGKTSLVQKSLYATALLETKADAEAGMVLESLIKENNEKAGMVIHYLKGNLLSRSSSTRAEAIRELEFFLRLVNQNDETQDPLFRWPERVERTKKLLEELKA